MAKKKTSKKFSMPGEIKDLLHKYKDTLVMHLLTLLEAKGKNVLEAFKNIGHIRQRIRKFFISMQLMFFGILFVLVGFALYLPQIWPSLTDGLNFLVLGLVLIIFGLIYKAAK